MKRRFCALLTALAFIAALAAAHGDKKHVIGTIQKLDAASVTIKTRDGKSVEVKLVSSTAYIKRVNTVDTPAAPLRPGSRRKRSSPRHSQRRRPRSRRSQILNSRRKPHNSQTATLSSADYVNQI